MDWQAIGLSLRLALATTLVLQVVGMPLAWWVVVVPVYLSTQVFLARVFTPRNNASPDLEKKGEAIPSPWPMRLLAAATALGAVAMDLALEPVAHVRGYWFWNSSSAWWYGVPALNFIGWAGVSFGLALGMQFLAGKPLRKGFRPGGAPLLLPLLLPVTVLAPFWIDLAGRPLAEIWISLLLIIWLCQTMFWTRFRPTHWARVLWSGPPGDAPATNTEMNRPDKS